MTTENSQISSNKYNCEICDYNTSRISNMNKHMTTHKHKNNQNSQISIDKYNCEICDYNTSHKSSMDKHLTTIKHKNNQNSQINSNKYNCNICDKKYNDRAGLWRHQKKCESKLEEPVGFTTQMFYDLLHQNNEFKDLIIKKDNEFTPLKI